MGVQFWQQCLTILRKNIVISFKSRAFFKELINIFVMYGFIMILVNVGSTQRNSQYIPVYMSIAIVMFCRGVALNWVNQKQSKQAQVQKIMGVTNLAYFSGWFSFFILNGVVLSLIFVGLLIVSGALVHSQLGYGNFIGLYILFMLASLSFVLFLSSFFSDATLASQIITFIQILTSLFYYLLFVTSFRTSKAGLQITAILPSLSFQYLIASQGPSSPTNSNLAFTSTQGYITLACLAVGYLVLFIYCQLVLPNDNGSHLHPLFFLNCFFNRDKEKEQLYQKLQLSDFSSARNHEQIKGQKPIKVQMKDLNKSFDGKIVVNKLSLSFFESEVFCLLGHNGAGKSTTINILTGILQPDSGKINILGYDYYTQMNEIRSKTGVCLQIDVLYDDLTVKEHLQFYAKLKGVPLEDLQFTVKQTLRKCGIQIEQHKKAKQLSGGNKRKTCLACAAIGKSQLLFLDQPSSGLDPNSRKVIWQLIQGLRSQGRTIILTTHHLQQAEALSNRIGILAHGQLLVLGSCHYLKQRFGCGYYLQIDLSKRNNLQDSKSQIRKQIKSLLKSFKEDDQVNEFSMRFQLPLSERQNFIKLFQFLQKQKIQFSLRLSSLEDIFIKIGIDPNSIFNNEALPNIEAVSVPEYQPKYTFATQFREIFLKKVRTTFRTFSVFTSIFLPVMFIVIGIVISMVAFKSAGSPVQQIIFNWSKFYTIAYFMSIAFCFTTASYCGNIVREREIKFSYLSYVMGMKKLPYWLGTITFDLLMFFLPFGIIFIVIACFPSSQNQLLVNSFGWLALTLLIFSFSFLSFTYLWSFAFDVARTAYRFYPFLVFLLFYTLPSIPIYIIPDADILIYILPLVSPVLALTNCMLSKQMIGSQLYNQIKTNQDQVQLFIGGQIWYPLMIMFIEGIVFMIVVLALDNCKFNLNDKQNLQKNDIIEHQSEDLKKQKEHIRNAKDSYPILVDSLYKKYPNGFVAVRDNSFYLQKGQTFGLLGPNGAGKSTTFNILTAAIPKTSGTVKLNNCEVNRSVAQIFTTVGVCPQFNPIYEQLTTQEHISFFAGMKGLEGEEKGNVINFYIKNLQLQQYRQIKAGKLSGGNKRKLCVAMSLIGKPSLLFLDEPSAGVDPISRRYLWNILHSCSIDKKRSMVLTTHSINEAQSLCDKIGILIKGQFYCIDSPSELKKRYGKGYRATARYQSQQNLQKVQQEIKKIFPRFNHHKFATQLKISFQFEKGSFMFSEAFNLFFNILLKNKLITQFQIAETTLQQVFIYLSKMQPEPQEIVEVKKKCCC